jgi:mono/diheme cytochrome c family protein
MPGGEADATMCLRRVRLRLLQFYSALIAISVTSAALAAYADNGRRLAEMRCAACHIVASNQRRDVADATPFEVIARKFATSPESLAFSLLDPHPRMNVMLTRREAQDIAAYINTLVK